MRRNIIEELYYGNIDPQDRGYRPKCTVKKASDSLNDLEEKLTEQLKAEEPMAWVQRMNGIRARVMEVVRQELIDT